jgi:fructose-bisphosphate aldolase class I
MDITKLNEVARQMVAPGKGILAADESTGTIEKRFQKIGVENTEDNRRAWREVLFTTAGIGDYISGVILYDETIQQNASDGRTFVKVLEDAGVIPGIKVDLGTEAMPDSPQEKLTKGLDGLPTRLDEYFALGARFAKWRAVITIGEKLPTAANLEQNALDLATYAKMCQSAGIVPIVEPEVLMDGAHTQARCEEVTTQTLVAVFNALREEGVASECIVLKPNMVVAGGKSGENPSRSEIAEATLRVFRGVVPHEVPGIAFLSGGQSELDATANLNEMAKRGPHPWKLTFSYGRALQESTAKVWAGKADNVAAAQQVFLKRARMNSLATLGKYEGEK